ncbi:MAG: PAS domain-containing sensor histidine kinase, partial [Lentisphaerae bacterium]
DNNFWQHILDRLETDPILEKVRVCMRTKDGTPHHFECTFNVCTQNHDLIFFRAQDIEPVLKQQEELDQTRQQFSHVIQALPMGIHLYQLEDDKLILTGANPAADRLTGIKTEKLLGLPIEEAFPNLSNTEVPRRYMAAAREGQSWQTTEFFYEDNQIKGIYDVYAFQISPGAMAAVFLDVTERRLQQLEIMKREENLRITLNSIGDAVIVTDKDGFITRMNPVAEKLTGWPEEEAVGCPIERVFHIINAETGEEVQSPVERVLREGRVVGLANHTILRSRDGREYQIADSGAPIYDTDLQLIGVVLVFRDVTEEYQRQEELRHARKMEAVGELAGGIAHDFNNMLAAIIGNIELIFLHGGEHLGKSRKYLNNVLETAKNAANLTSKLLLFSRKQSLVRRWIEPDQLIRNTIELLKPGLPPDIQLHWQPSNDLPLIMGDYSLLQSVIINLGINARDAMPNGGTITIEADQYVLDCDDIICQTYDLRPGPYLRIQVKDTGEGIAPEIQKRIFEPFFTTKPPGKGTGLGLSAVYGTIREHGGGITIDSEPGKGATFTLFLPVESTSLDDHEHERNIGSSPSRDVFEKRFDNLHIIVADDDESIRNNLTELLRQSGAHVIAAEKGSSVIEKVKNGKVEIVILDLIMPELDGRQTYHKIREINPTLPILLISGYDLGSENLELTRDPFASFVAKPFTFDQISSEIERLLSC